MKAKTAKQVLQAARWIIKHVGWCQRAFAKDVNGRYLWGGSKTPGSCYCPLGAIRVVEADEELLEEARQLLRNHHADIVGFNDASYRTKEEVLQWFDLAIAQAP